MTMSLLSLLHHITVLFAFITHVRSVAPTGQQTPLCRDRLQLTMADEYRDGDAAQSSYFDNHNIDPAVVDSAQFGLLWKQSFNNKEQFYAKPLTFTPNGGKQLVFLASSMNYIRTLDAVTGTLINSRQVQTPFLQSDIGCTDIPNYIGIIGSRSLIQSSGNTGTFNGVYYFYAVHVSDLSDVDGFPILVDGSIAQNDNRKYFVGGTILQRPSLLQVGSTVFAAFGGHCDLFNYTGTVLGVDIKQKKVVTNFAVEAGPNSAFSTDWTNNGAGGQGGIWQAGMSLASDGNRLFFATGNGNGGENQGIPASGSSGCRTLGEAVVNLAIDTTTGVLSLTDYFQPYDYVNMDGGDQDFGSGGVSLLDPTIFNGTGVARLCITTGKNGALYLINADNLGGYKQGTGGTDLVVQEIVTSEAVFGGVGSYPLEGGYIYSTPVGYPTYVYKLGFTASGKPNFVLAGTTAQKSAGRVGPGVPTITTYKGRPGTAIMWLTDPDAGIRAWYAVPNPDQAMTPIKLPQIGGVVKFQRPAFGDGRVYTTDANGALYCLGSPVNLPLNCTSPVDFGSVVLGSSKTATIQCTALTTISQVNSITTGDLHFVVDQSALPTGAVAQGASFAFNVTWNLVNVTVSAAKNASYGNTTPGVKSTPLTIRTTNAVAGFANSFPLSLTGTEVSKAAFLQVVPQTANFGGLILGVAGNPTTSSLSFTIANLGQSDLHILGYAYTSDTDRDDGDADFTNVTNTAGVWDLGKGFSTTALPALDSVLKAGQSALIPTLFNATNATGDYLSYLNVWSDGGTAGIILEGSTSTAAVVVITTSTSEGGLSPCSVTDCTMSFGTQSPGQTAALSIQVCNVGGSVLTVTKSKPPLGAIKALNYGIDLHETQQIPVNSCANGTVVFSPAPGPPNLADYTVVNQWTLNTDDLSFGVHVVNMTGIVHGRQIGPLYPNGSAIFNYLGCYLDNGAGQRLLGNEPYVDTVNNTNQECQTACQKAGYTFSGTEYRQECYCGDNLPSSQWYHPESDTKCTFACIGDDTQACGGDGGYISVYYDSSKYSITDQTYNTSGTIVSGPQTVLSVPPYNYLGCYSEGQDQRALSGSAPGAASTGGTVDYCASQCAQSQFQYMGVEYSNECVSF
ncbi:hypothetical protein LTR78_001340 [Recurvomyces mirabilis]|uniref:WSC domain-containing protein n=1 Tax=Recurvomyces mirabilis TaxID=574656 RepID=A0AAE1C5L1_9PEZI|nr:hypothetical protein LTR78_001340 [Recurvomyces mirabilis]KAK5161317.1 hypothetical protein LTS14_001113 [Recurvomyces mirabilis]